VKGTENLRPEVLAFAKAMEAKLRMNDAKGGWGNLTAGQVVKRLREELEEMCTAALMQEGGVLEEAADVANFAMMFAQLSGELKT
jgi:phosphoribosyl-ATP pyrophosphohydrolase